MGARWEAVRLFPSASVWFEPNVGQVKGRTEFVGRTRGAFLPMTGREVVYAMAPAVVARGAEMRRYAAVCGREEGACAASGGGVNGGLNPLYQIGGARSMQLARRVVF